MLPIMTSNARVEALDLAIEAGVAARRKGVTYESNPRSEKERVDLVFSSALQWLGSIRSYEDLTPAAEVTVGQMQAKANEVAENLKTMSTMRFVVERALDAQTGLYVQRARTLGLSWQKIGEAMGMTAQGIYKKAKQLGWVSEFDPELE